MAIITICRGTKSGGKALAKCVAERLGYPMVGREVLQDAAAELGVRPEDVGEKLEERPSPAQVLPHGSYHSSEVLPGVTGPLHP